MRSVWPDGGDEWDGEATLLVRLKVGDSAPAPLMNEDGQLSFSELGVKGKGRAWLKGGTDSLA